MDSTRVLKKSKGRNALKVLKSQARHSIEPEQRCSDFATSEYAEVSNNRSGVCTWNSTHCQPWTVPRRHLISERGKTGRGKENTGMTREERNERADMRVPDSGSIDLMRQDKYSNDRC